MSNCTCGRTFRPPLCDGSHWMPDEEYRVLREKIESMKAPQPKQNKENNMTQQPYPITVGGNWIDQVKESIPDHSKDIRLNLDSVINRSPLSAVDTHAVAYVAAIACGNGGLAFEIEHNGPLFADERVREAAKCAASLMGMNNVYYPFVEMCGDSELKGQPAGLRMQAYASHGGVSKVQFEAYALAASIVGRCTHCVKSHYDILKKEGLTVQQLQHVGKIAAVIVAIGKIAV